MMMISPSVVVLLIILVSSLISLMLISLFLKKQTIKTKLVFFGSTMITFAFCFAYYLFK